MVKKIIGIALNTTEHYFTYRGNMTETNQV